MLSFESVTSLSMLLLRLFIDDVSSEFIPESVEERFSPDITT